MATTYDYHSVLTWYGPKSDAYSIQSADPGLLVGLVVVIIQSHHFYLQICNLTLATL